MIALEFTGTPSTIWGLPTHIHLQTGIHDAFVRVGGTVGSPNEASAYLSLLLPLAACLLFAGVKSSGKWLSCLVIGFGGVAMIFTYSRGGWIALALAAILVSFVLVRTRGISSKAPIALLARARYRLQRLLQAGAALRIEQAVEHVHAVKALAEVDPPPVVVAVHGRQCPVRIEAEP